MDPIKAWADDDGQDDDDIVLMTKEELEALRGRNA